MTGAQIPKRPDLPHPCRALPLAVLATLGLAACTQFPELDARTADIDPRTPYPALVPLDPLLARAKDDQITGDTESRLDARAAGLRARAAAMRGDVIGDDTRARMAAGVTR